MMRLNEILSSLLLCAGKRDYEGMRTLLGKIEERDAYVLAQNFGAIFATLTHPLQMADGWYSLENLLGETQQADYLSDAVSSEMERAIEISMQTPQLKRGGQIIALYRKIHRLVRYRKPFATSSNEDLFPPTALQTPQEDIDLAIAWGLQHDSFFKTADGPLFERGSLNREILRCLKDTGLRRSQIASKLGCEEDLVKWGIESLLEQGTVAQAQDGVLKIVETYGMHTIQGRSAAICVIGRMNPKRRAEFEKRLAQEDKRNENK